MTPPRTFGAYTEQAGRQKQDQVDRLTGQTINRLRQLGACVPGNSSFNERAEEIVRSVEELADDQRALVSSLTDSDSSEGES